MRQVVGAAIIADYQPVQGVGGGPKRILLTQRRWDKSFPFGWETPGGKVNEGETLEAAMRREIFEEIGLSLLAVKQTPLWEGDVVVHGHAPLHYTLFHVVGWAGQVELREGQAGMGWFTVGEVCSMKERGMLLPANTAGIAAITGALV